MEKKTCVLIVDDNQGMLETLRDILEVYGFEVVTAADATSAMEEFRKRTCDVGVVDVMLPGMNGVELVRALAPQHPDTRFIIITAYSESSLANEARSLGKVLFKPIEPTVLIQTIREMTGEK